jgi:hypothetical protein
MDELVNRLEAEKAIHKAIIDECFKNRKTSAGQYSAVAVAALRALPPADARIAKKK